MSKWSLIREDLQRISNIFEELDTDFLILSESFVDNEDGTYEFGLHILDSEDNEIVATLVSLDSLTFNATNAEDIGYKWADTQLYKILAQCTKKADDENEAIELFRLGITAAINDFCKGVLK